MIVFCISSKGRFYYLQNFKSGYANGYAYDVNNYGNFSYWSSFYETYTEYNLVNYEHYGEW